MNRIGTAMVTGALALAMAAGVFAEDRIPDRKENQQDRIAQGINNGTLSAGEAARLERKEAKLNQKIRTDRKEN